jgi:hypothetical protein
MTLVCKCRSLFCLAVLQATIRAHYVTLLQHKSLFHSSELCLRCNIPRFVPLPIQLPGASFIGRRASLLPHGDQLCRQLHASSRAVEKEASLCLTVCYLEIYIYIFSCYQPCQLVKTWFIQLTRLIAREDFINFSRR